MKTIICDTPETANAIAEQLYNSTFAKRLRRRIDLHDRVIIYTQANSAAVEVAMSLTDGIAIVPESHCRLPFPREERECGYGPMIYVACLAAYNNGTLHGLWIDAEREPDEIMEDIEWMLSWSPEANPCNPHEWAKQHDWAIHDREGFCGFDIDENDNLERISAIAIAIGSLSEDDRQAFEVWNPDDSIEADEIIEKFREAFYGVYDSKEDFASEWIEQCGVDFAKMEVNLGTGKVSIETYIDYDAIVRDLEIDLFILERKDSKVYAFRKY